MLPVAILVGGLATRLGSITDSIPKALVPVAGRPFILQQLDYLHDQGVSQVVLCTGYRASQIKEIVGDGSCCGLVVQYSDDGDTLLGTGGAVRNALPLLGPEFFVLYGDSFLPINFKDVENAYLESQQPALMTVYRNRGQWDTSNVVFSIDRVIEYNKFEPRTEMQYIDYGLGILSGAAFYEQVNEEVFDLATLYMTLSKKGELAGYKACQRFYEIGSPEGLAETDQYFKSMSSV